MSIHMCNQKFRILADEVAKGVEEAGGKAFTSHQPVISDGQSMGTVAMRYSLASRDLIVRD